MFYHVSMSDNVDPNPSDEPVVPAESLEDKAKQVLEENDRGNYVAPDNKLYPHQWLWDSCFIAIGQRHIDPSRAQTELTNLLKGQWSNGMIPNMIFSNAAMYQTDRNYWRSWINPHAPEGVATSGITQPPVLAEAVWQVGQSFSATERRSWYNYMLPSLVRYHEWLYADRDPHNEGLILLLHPWETGTDNTPPWMTELSAHLMPTWVQIIKKLRLEPVVGLFRRDRKSIPADQRFSTLEILTLFSAQRRLRRKAYDTTKILNRGLFSIEDLTFNSIFIKANSRLIDIARIARKTLPEELIANMKRTEAALEQLWDPYASYYWSRDFVTHRLLKQPSIATLMPLYAGSISKERASLLVQHLENQNRFGTNFPVPSVPADSPQYDADRYWQGPSWVNTNWMIIEGLRQYGFHDHAKALTENTLAMVEKSGFAEYFNPENGEPLGADNFSWTAALVIDLIHQK